jgi:hypothetical protein
MIWQPKLWNMGLSAVNPRKCYKLSARICLTSKLLKLKWLILKYKRAFEKNLKKQIKNLCLPWCCLRLFFWRDFPAGTTLYWFTHKQPMFVSQFRLLNDFQDVKCFDVNLEKRRAIFFYRTCCVYPAFIWTVEHDCFSDGMQTYRPTSTM